MTPSESLAALLCADPATLKHLRNSIDELLAAHVCRAAAPTSPPPVKLPQPTKIAPVPLAASLRTLAPLRAPRPGSLRDDIYRVLAGHTSLTRAEVIEAVTNTRPHKDRAHLVSKIHDALNHARDPRIQRLRRGVYSLVAR
jgi:hypothetical protein